MNPVESRTDAADANRAWLSALADGRSEACEPAVAAWARDAEARRTWHAYQLIGDVLRSEDLANSAARDEAFLQAVRARLASEPAVLAPQAATTASAAAGRDGRRSSLRWGAAAAVAGVALVGGVVFTLQRGGSEPMLASGTVVAPGGETTLPLSGTALGQPAIRVGTMPVRGSSASTTTEPEAQQWHMLDERLLRDARLDSYLRAHRGGVGLGGARVEPAVLER